MLFDDCLSAVDTKTEELILQNIKENIKDKSCLIISHRASSIRHADLILVLHDGEILERGSHDNLVQLKGEYFRTYQKQLVESK